MSPEPHFDNRRSSRIRAEHEVSLSAKPAPEGRRVGEDAGGRLILYGYTRDLSECGMAVVAPSFDCAHLEILYGGREVDVSLNLPQSSVAARAVAVRAVPLSEQEPGAGCVIALTITGMREADRRRYAELLGRGAKA